MADNFGLKIGVEGEKEFKKALADINSQFKVLGSEMKLATSQFEKNENSVESLTSKNEVLTKQIDAQKEKIETLRKALENASDSFGENDRRTQQWVVALNNAEAELNGMERELKDNEKAIDGMGDEAAETAKQTDKLGDELDQTGDQAEKSGGKFSKLGSVLKGVGTAMGVALAAIGTAAVAAGKALVDMTVEAAAYADEMLTQSTVTGMSVESLQAYSYAADLVDVSLDTLTGSMAKNVKSMANAADGSAKYADAYAQLGVSVTDANGNLLDSEEVYWEVIDALGGISNETERDALAMQLFGKSAQDLNPLIAQGSEGIAALTDEAKRMGAVLSEETIAKLGAFDDSVQRLKQGSEAAKRVMGTVLLPQLQDLAGDGTKLLGEFTSGLVEAGDDFDKISEVIGNTVGGLANMIMEHLPKIIQVGMDIVMAIGKAIVENLPTLVECASSIIMTLVEGLVEALPAVTDSAVQLVMTLVQGIIDNLPAIVEAAINMIVTLAMGIADALPELIPSIVEAVILICQVLLDNMDKILEAAFAIIKGLAEGLLNALPKLVEALPEIITTIINFITDNLPAIIEMGIELIVQLAVGLIQAIPQLVVVFSSKLVCGDCGGFFGQKVWHSTDAYRKVIWRCNSKFKGDKKCATPHLDTETIQQKFLIAYNRLMGSRDSVVRDCELMRAVLSDCTVLDAEIDRLTEEIIVVAELVKTCVKENASAAQSQEDYTKKYDALVKRYEKATKRVDELSAERTQKQDRDRELWLFIQSIKEQPLVLEEWNERLWVGLLDKATVFHDGRMVFEFKNGTEIEVEL